MYDRKNKNQEKEFKKAVIDSFVLRLKVFPTPENLEWSLPSSPIANRILALRCNNLND